MQKGFVINAVVSLCVIAASTGVIAVTRHGTVELPFAVRHETARSRTPASSDAVEPVRVAVMNGSGVPGVAASFVRNLRLYGFDVVNGNGENADSFDYRKSVVIDRRGNRAWADSAAHVLGIGAVLSQRSESPYLIEDIVVVLGRDFKTLQSAEEEKRSEQ
jgi:hypothetical protein